MRGDQKDAVRRVVFLAATEVEAAPLLDAARVVERTEVATKELYLGELDVSTAEADSEVGRPAACGRPDTIPVVLVISGCDKVNAAHALTCVLQTVSPEPLLVVQVGIAGAFQGRDSRPTDDADASPPDLGDVVLATQEAYSDTGSSSREGWLSAEDIGLPIARSAGGETYGVFPLDVRMVESARAAITAILDPEGGTRVHAGPCITSSLVTGTREQADALVSRWGALAESMEGAAAAHVSALHETPFLEVRGISNLVGDRDRAGWQVEKAAAVAARAALAAVRGLESEWRGGRHE